MFSCILGGKHNVSFEMPERIYSNEIFFQTINDGLSLPCAGFCRSGSHIAEHRAKHKDVISFIPPIVV